MSFKTVLLVCLLGFVAAQNAAKPAAPATKPASGVTCYQCNSLTSGQSNCDSSDEDALAKYKKVCPRITEGELAGTDAVACRKVHQTVTGETGIVRECAYTGAEEIDGKRRIGNKGIVLYLYQCNNEKPNEPCNGAASTSLVALALFTAFSAIFNLSQ